jgi:hypothetical protein
MTIPMVAIIDNTDSGFGVSAYGVTGFVEHTQAWRDDNENNSRDPSEIFLDFNNDGMFDGDSIDPNGDFIGPDGVFNGPQCIPGNLLCARLWFW